MVDNFELIKKHIVRDRDYFYHCSVICRGKDNPGLKGDKVIKTWLVTGPDHLDKIRPDIEILCKAYNARAYINIGPKSMDKLNKLVALRMNNNIYHGNVIDPINHVISCCGSLVPWHKKWIVDVDIMDYKKRIEDHISDVWGQTHMDAHCWKIAEIPTKTGVHLIVHPFNLEEFKKLEPEVDVHKNNPTCLYIP